MASSLCIGLIAPVVCCGNRCDVSWNAAVVESGDGPDKSRGEKWKLEENDSL